MIVKKIILTISILHLALLQSLMIISQRYHILNIVQWPVLQSQGIAIKRDPV